MHSGVPPPISGKLTLASTHGYLHGFYTEGHGFSMCSCTLTLTELRKYVWHRTIQTQMLNLSKTSLPRTTQSLLLLLSIWQQRKSVRVYNCYFLVDILNLLLSL